MEHIKELIFKMGDDAMIIGHRNSEWTGLGPTLEEDIAFSSMAQDKVGHATNLYEMLHESFEEDTPDNIAFNRKADAYKCCHLVEKPIGEFDFSLVRQFLFDHAEMARYQALSNSSYEPLANFAKKIKGEIKYHIFHADTWMTQLGNGSEESKARLQNSLNEAMPLALGIFEPSQFEDQLISEKVFVGEKAIQAIWLANISKVIEHTALTLPDISSMTPSFGGRKGEHTEDLQNLLNEMSELFLQEGPGVAW